MKLTYKQLQILSCSFIACETFLSFVGSSKLVIKPLNIDSRNVFGVTPLHIAKWRNHVPIVKRQFVDGADYDARDGESGWNNMHKAFHFDHLSWQSVLLQSRHVLRWRTLNDIFMLTFYLDLYLKLKVL